MAKNKWINKKMNKKRIRPSAQNPALTKYRDQAKVMLSSGFISNFTQSLPENKTEFYLNLVDENYKPVLKTSSNENLDKMSNDDLSIEFNEDELKNLKGYKDDIMSEAETFATNFTNCTNISFSYFLRNFDNSSEMHKEMLTILAAATELINSSGNNGTNEDYYFILVKSLYTNENVLSLTSNVILLFYVIKGLSTETIKAKFGEFQMLINKLLKKHMNSTSTTFFRFLIKTYIIFLTNLDLNDWKLIDTQSNLIDNLLRFITHPKSRIRKLTRKSIVNLFKTFFEHGGHPIFKITLDYSIKKIHTTNGDDITETLHILNLWKEAIIYLPVTELKQLFENILSLLTLENALVYSNCMQVLENLFLCKTNLCTQDLNNKLILALYNYQPSLNDTQPLLAWSYVMKLAELNMHKLNSDLFIDHILKLFKIYFSVFKNSNHNTEKFIFNCINEILETAINTYNAKPDIFLSIGEILKSFLSLKYKSSLKYILKIVSTFFKLSGKEYDSIIENLFDKIFFLKNSDSDAIHEQFCDNIYKNLIDYHGAELLLKKFPLELEFDNLTVKNIWLIQVIHKHLKKDKIGNFIKYILPCSELIYEHLKLLNKNEDIDNTNQWLFHYTNLWSLLPIFLNEPTDIQDCFNKIAKNLGTFLKESSHIRIFILKSLRQLIIKSVEQDKVEIAKYAKNYIPILLNLYLTEEVKSVKLSIYSTLYYWFSISDNKLIESIYDKIIRNIDGQLDTKKKLLFYDLLLCIINNVKNEQKIIQTFDEGLKVIQNKLKRHEQKKGFRLIEELLKSNNHLIIEKYFQQKKDNLYDFMFKYFVENFSSIYILASQASLVRIIQNLVIEKFKKDKSFDEFKSMLYLLVDIINSKKSHKLSHSTFNLLYTIIDLKDNGPVQSILMLIENLNVNNFSLDKKVTSFFMMNNILKKYNENIDNKTKSTLIKFLLDNLDNQNNKMIKIILTFIRDWFKITTREEMLPLIDNFVNYLNSIEDPEFYMIKFKIKNIIEKLIKKFGYEIINKLLDNKYRNLIKNLNKKCKKEKTEKKKVRFSEFDESGKSDSENEENDNHSKVKRTKSNKRWNFGNEEEDEDFEMFNQVNLNIFNKDNSSEIDIKNIETDSIKIKNDNDNDIIKIDNEGKIITLKEENNMNNESSDSENETKVDNKKYQNIASKKISQRIMDKYRRRRGIHRDLTANFKTGTKYKSKKAFGDMKKNNAPEPYAYLPLNRAILNKRKSLKNKTKIKNLIKAAFKGASNTKLSSNKTSNRNKK